VACNLNVIQAANQLGLHPNTIRSRLAKVERLTGLDARRVIDVMELVTVMKLSSAAEAGNRKKMSVADTAGAPRPRAVLR